VWWEIEGGKGDGDVLEMVASVPTREHVVRGIH
jgi:hypothetical protein